MIDDYDYMKTARFLTSREGQRGIDNMLGIRKDMIDAIKRSFDSPNEDGKMRSFSGSMIAKKVADGMKGEVTKEDMSHPVMLAVSKLLFDGKLVMADTLKRPYSYNEDDNYQFAEPISLRPTVQAKQTFFGWMKQKARALVSAQP